jgi:hypothetical protein
MEIKLTKNNKSITLTIQLAFSRPIRFAKFVSTDQSRLLKKLPRKFSLFIDELL